jgi:hypothetical protein
MKWEKFTNLLPFHQRNWLCRKQPRRSLPLHHQPCWTFDQVFQGPSSIGRTTGGSSVRPCIFSSYSYAPHHTTTAHTHQSYYVHTYPPPLTSPLTHTVSTANNQFEVRSRRWLMFGCNPEFRTVKASVEPLRGLRGLWQRQYLILTFMLTLYSTLICFCHLSRWVVTRCSPTQWWYPFCCELILSWALTCLTNFFHLQAFSRAYKIAICYITNKSPDRRKSVLLESFLW